MVRVQTKGNRAAASRRKVRRLRCPSCGSDALDYEAAMITGQRYHCRSCDYLGPVAFDVAPER